MATFPSTSWSGLLLVLLAGWMTGIYTLPMRFLGRWAWENVWAIFIAVSCIAMPVIATVWTAPNAIEVLRSTPGHAVISAVIAGFAWGFGAIMFGQGVSAIGVAMSNTLVLAISAALGSFLPMMVLAPERARQPQGLAIMAGTAVGMISIGCFGYAGFARDRSQTGKQNNVRRRMVGKARPFGVGMLLCAGAGMLSAVLNIGFSVAQPVIRTAVQRGDSSFGGTCIVWMLALGAGSIPNLIFCFYLMVRNASWRNFAAPRPLRLYSASMLMGLLWGGDILVYGTASPMLGKLGPAIGWPIKLIGGMVAANVAGMLIGEWNATQRPEKRWLAAGFVTVLIAVALLSWSSTLA
jgi:L-rhamnose-H+ transport protein